MTLDILIPQYKETDEVIKPLLDSIAIQQNVDLENEVGVIICNDGDNNLYFIEFKIHRKNIEFYYQITGKEIKKELIKYDLK